MAQKKNFTSYTITAGGGTQTRPIGDNCDGYIVYADGGAVTLLADMEFDVSGTPALNDTIVTYHMGGVDTQSGLYSVKYLSVTLTQYQAMVPLTITGIWNGTSWDVSIVQSVNPVVGYLYDGTFITPLSIKNASIKDDEIGLGKIEVLASAEFVIGSSTGNKTVPFSGDGTVDENGVLTVTLGASTALKTEMLVVDVSFEAGEVGAYLIDMPFPCTVTNVYAYAEKAIAGTDNGTVVLKDGSGTTMTVTTPIVFVASDPRGTAYESAVTANNAFTAGQKMTILTAKTTAGGKVKVTLTLLRTI